MIDGRPLNETDQKIINGIRIVYYIVAAIVSVIIGLSA